ncbi:hypothetical protein SCHPADRAFT_889832 [Schizopora paradoxa]|uniref:MYND-type domain-containing protein n=1 Tax=Schizopora paradoxa TaxID=27342 RepID=A0A0H2RWC2_9AGAM|nr:hypothetical protein SCHPADRAFT_889832 [Schizopora paradoxa]
MSTRQYARERAKWSKQRTDQELRHVMSTTVPRAKSGDLQAMKYLSEGAERFPEFVTLDVFGALLENLQASKVPPVETLPTSFVFKADGSFRNINVERALQAIRGLANTASSSHVIQSKPEICELLIDRWPDVLSWMWYFYIACFERDLADKKYRKHMHRNFCMMFAVGRAQKKCALGIADIPGTIRFATMICMLDPEGSFLTKDDVCTGTFTLMHLLHLSIPATINSFLLDEVVEALGGDSKLFIDTIVARLLDSFSTPEIIEKAVTTYLTIFVVLEQIPQHPLSAVSRTKNLIVIGTTMLLRAMDILSDANCGRSDPDYPSQIRRVAATFLSLISAILIKGENRIKQALQAFQAGIMTALLELAPLAYAFEPLDRDWIVSALRQLTRLTTQIPIARQASAELERLESRCSIQAQFNASTCTLNVRNAWVAFYDAIIARRKILSQIQALDSTPMACDNCFRFDERANFKKCAGCGMAHYCSKDCQSRAWKEKGHRTECKTLKGKPAKRRTARQEMYFLARVAVNDAQDKKEQMMEIARIGLRYISVTVDYTEFPPRCTVGCDMDELQSYLEKTSEITKATSRLMNRCEAERSQDPGLCSERSSPLPDSEKQILDILFEHSSYEFTDSKGAEVCRIQLVDGEVVTDATGKLTNRAPPIQLIVLLPSVFGSPPREEHFVIDDFWEFVHIKFEDNRVGLPELFQEMDEEDKYTFRLDNENEPPDVQELRRRSLLWQSQAALAIKEKAYSVEQTQDKLLDLVRKVGNNRAEAVKIMMSVAKRSQLRQTSSDVRST